MTHWQAFDVPAMRHEALYGDRIVRCFAERPRNLWAMFEAARASHASDDAMVCNGRRWSYGELGDAAQALSAELAEKGVASGERVLMWMGNRPEFVIMLLALQRLGAIAVPVGVREQRPGMSFIATQCGACAIVYDDELADRLPLPEDVPALRLPLPASEVAAALARPKPQGKLPPAATPRETQTAVILYTSGTTGKPKGAMLTHIGLAHSALHYQACMQLRPGDRSALAVPASHVTGLVAIIVAMWQAGGAVIVVPEFKADAFVDLMQKERVSHTLMVPAMYQLCLRSERLAGADLSAWRIGGYGGAPMPVATIDALAERVPGLVLINAYGATETTSPATMMPAGQTRSHADSVGVALPAADIRVMDDEGREVPPGQKGELWIGGPMVVPGYWANPEATAASFTAGYWHSGDLGSVDADGFVRIFDRIKDMLNRGGYKIYSVEVENVLMGCPGVVEAAVIGRPCPVLGERVHAVLYAPELLQGDLPAAQAAVRERCAAALADYKVPETFEWRSEPLPRNANGKLMKRLLRQPTPAA
ncbi:class I adenylate-forming enzyme family protein [Variovorax dokdonensis]|uniref:Class I adenylate-forming enzyme family protein n=1 Tax=Variovorax dokdonensis TaxID=344883 RepID=A0ABT7NFJ3_9BURK|nr:class I adenylate-forming enzyme family protein [Variovorax dokdonensis]MDM0046687.1 class I adenylate-forming enzyme family protein [Variovorax dokdonensis]